MMNKLVHPSIHHHVAIIDDDVDNDDDHLSSLSPYLPCQENGSLPSINAHLTTYHQGDW
jgi:hypothetical protein